MPQVHSAGLTFTLMHLYAGATVRILPQFDAAEFISLVARERVTSALTVPTRRGFPILRSYAGPESSPWTSFPMRPSRCSTA